MANLLTKSEYRGHAAWHMEKFQNWCASSGWVYRKRIICHLFFRNISIIVHHQSPVKDENIGKSRIFLSLRKEAFTDHQKTPVAE